MVFTHWVMFSFILLPLVCPQGQTETVAYAYVYHFCLLYFNSFINIQNGQTPRRLGDTGCVIYILKKKRHCVAHNSVQL